MVRVRWNKRLKSSLLTHKGWNMFYSTSTTATVHAHMQISVQSFKKRYKLPLSVHATGINTWYKRKEKHLFINLRSNYQQGTGFLPHQLTKCSFNFFKMVKLYHFTKMLMFSCSLFRTICNLVVLILYRIYPCSSLCLRPLMWKGKHHWEELNLIFTRATNLKVAHWCVQSLRNWSEANLWHFHKQVYADSCH